MTENIENPASSPVNQPAPQPSAAEIAEHDLGHIDWVSATEGYCECPGKDHHTTKDGLKDCIVYLDRIPTLHCVHASCGPVIEQANRKLRAAILNPDGKADGRPRRLTAEDKARLKERENKNRIRQRAAKSLPQILLNHRWHYAAIIADSPVDVAGQEKDHWRLLLRRFRPEDVVWIGDTYSSGKSEHAKNFRTVAEWLEETKAPGPFTCPSVFKNNCYARSNDNVIERRFLVVESDTLTKEQVGAVFKWLQEKCGLELVAVVDTAGKSLHGWFVYPKQEHVVEELKLVLPALQCDPKLFTASQPVRLPGALRDGKYQRLVYLTEEVDCE